VLCKKYIVAPTVSNAGGYVPMNGRGTIKGAQIRLPGLWYVA